ncbi:hypothetical protein H9L19_01080 [Weissella diestrammenae]|uniref:Uncharacterized protein n=1 Tax=Weissella diestrammenae TaxID=1162633 RepID=A0A7G9T600_9LACO|nr:hypothetical protein [Weissella diestrammenae]QNN75525.1 hypothetical protein H9L19_01080 [Weissella diestrammenae]
MKSLTEHLFEIKSLTNPFVIDGQIFITVSQADSENNSYRHDLARVIDNQLETVVTDITDVQVTNEHIFYLKANQIYQYFEHSEDKQLTRQSEIITQILPLPDDEHILYVAQITASQPGLNVDQKRPQIHQVSQLTYKADGKGFIFSQPQFELRSVDVTSNDRLLKQFEQEIQIADARSEQKILLMLVDYDKDGLGQKKQLVDFDYRTDLTRIISDKTMVMVDEAIYNPRVQQFCSLQKTPLFQTDACHNYSYIRC